jgi:hypothetical protein
LNRFPELKKFVKYGGAENYQNVEVEFISGKNAILAIYNDGVEQEQVALQGIPTEKEMHQLMLDKGFILKPEEELNEVKERGEEERQKDEEKKGRIQRKQEEKQQKIMNGQKKATENLDLDKQKELKEITLRIKELKKEGGDKEIIKELTRRRTQLARETMMITQANFEKTDGDKERFKKVVREGMAKAKPLQKEHAVESDEL